MRIRIEGTDLPGASCGPSPQRPEGHFNVHVGVQRRSKPVELFGVVRGDSPGATWTLEATPKAAPDGSVDLTGPYIQGRPGGRFIYLCWGTVEASGTFAMFRRAKLQFDAVSPELLRSAAEQGCLVCRVSLTDPKGNPVCASLGAPFIEWAAAPA